MDKESALKILADWLKGQPFNNVMAVLLLVAMTVLGYVGLYDVVPAERKAIQSMAEQMELQQSKQIDRVCDSFDRSLDRWQQRDRERSQGTSKVANTTGK